MVDCKLLQEQIILWCIKQIQQQTMLKCSSELLGVCGSSNTDHHCPWLFIISPIYVRMNEKPVIYDKIIYSELCYFTIQMYA